MILQHIDSKVIIDPLLKIFLNAMRNRKHFRVRLYFLPSEPSSYQENVGLQKQVATTNLV